MKKLILAALIAGAPSIASAQAADDQTNAAQSQPGFFWWDGGRPEEGIVLPALPRDGMRITFKTNKGNGNGMNVVGTLKRMADGQWELDGEYTFVTNGRTPACKQTPTIVSGPHWGRIVMTFNAQFTRFQGRYDACRRVNLFSRYSGSKTSRAMRLPATQTRASAPDRDALGNPILDPEMPAPGASPAPNPAPAPSPPQREEPTCDYVKFSQIMRAEGGALIQAFADETLKLAEQDDANVIDEPIFEYNREDIQAGFVSTDEHEFLLKLNGIVGEMIANQGGDDYLKDNRAKIVDALNAANFKYRSEALAKKDCPTFRGAEAYATFAEAEVQSSLMEQHATQTTPARGNPDVSLRSDLDQITNMVDRYGNIVFNKLGNTGDLPEKLIRVGTDMYNRYMDDSGYSTREKRYLTRELEQAEANLERRKSAGETITANDINQETKAAFDRAGITYHGPLSDEQADDQRKEKAAIAISLYLGSKFASSVTTGGVATVLQKSAYLKLAYQLSRVVNAVFDRGTVEGVNKRDMPTLNAARERKAHLEDLVDRHRLLRERFSKLNREYEALFASALARSQRN